MRTIQQDYRYIRKVIRSIDSIPQIRSCERLVDNWLNNHTQSLGYGRLLTAEKLRDYLYDQVSDKFPDFDYIPNEEVDYGSPCSGHDTESERNIEEEKAIDWEKAEERMNIIGRNGNDGIHYDTLND